MVSGPRLAIILRTIRKSAGQRSPLIPCKLIPHATKSKTCCDAPGPCERALRVPERTASDEYLQVALAMRYYQHARVLSVGLSRKLRADSELNAMIPELSVSRPPPEVCLWRTACARLCRRTRCIGPSARCRSTHALPPVSWSCMRGEKVLLVDDILRYRRQARE
jgi:hypothetical protein